MPLQSSVRAKDLNLLGASAQYYILYIGKVTAQSGRERGEHRSCAGVVVGAFVRNSTSAKVPRRFPVRQSSGQSCSTSATLPSTCFAIVVVLISAYLFFARETPTVDGERPKDALKNVKQRQVEQPSSQTKRANKAARVPKSASSSSGRRQRSRSRSQHCPLPNLVCARGLGHTGVARKQSHLPRQPR